MDYSICLVDQGTPQVLQGKHHGLIKPWFLLYELQGFNKTTGG